MALTCINGPQPFDGVIYINGQKRRATHLGSRFFVDSDSLPGRPCSQHGLKPASVAHLREGGEVRTSGNRYSLRPPEGQP